MYFVIKKRNVYQVDEEDSLLFKLAFGLLSGCPKVWRISQGSIEPTKTEPIEFQFKKKTFWLLVNGQKDHGFTPSQNLETLLSALQFEETNQIGRTQCGVELKKCNSQKELNKYPGTTKTGFQLIWKRNRFFFKIDSWSV